MSKENKRGNGCGCFLGIIVIILIISITVFIFLYTRNPVKFENDLNVVIDNMKEYIEKTTGTKIVEDNIELPEKENLTEAQKYYYYQQLSDTAKRIYVTIENNIERIKNGDDNIPLPPSLNEIAKSNENGKELIAKEFQSAWDAFITDRSEYFYIDSSKVCLVTKSTTKGSVTNYEFFIGKGDNKNYFIQEFRSKEEVELAIKKIENEKNEILKGATGNNYEKIKYIHDWIVNNVKYDTSNGDNSSNVYGCMVNKSVVCEGYARTFKYLLDELNIPCVLVSGIAVDENGNSERHAWNYVYIKNAWYAVDTTWDDPIIIGNGIVSQSVNYKYFLKGSNTMKNDHTTIGQITNDGIEFNYPELSVEDIS